jgi:YD repeat-containing protein
MNTKLLLLLMVTGCGVDTSTGAAGSPDVDLQPRLERIGSDGSVAFDAAGYPTRIAAPGATYTFSWEAGELQQVVAVAGDERVDARLTTSGGRVTALDATCTGSCPHGASRHEQLAYGANGNLATWDLGDTRRTYSYDAEDRLVAIDGGDQATRFTYTADGCPQFATEGAAKLEYVYDDNGRIDGTANERGVVGIAYNRDGLIDELEGSKQPLGYGDGDALGLDLWPAHYGFEGVPAHGELFRLDGRCDPSLHAQRTILALVVGSLL